MRYRRILLLFAVLIFILFVSFLIFELKLYPIVEKAALAESRNLATVTLNEAIYEVLTDERAGEGDYVRLERGENGEIVSLTTDTTRVNIVKSLISKEVEKRLGQGDVTVYIPFGNITGIKLLSGRGPCIKVKTMPVRSVVTDIGAAFLESGINQTWHRVVLKVDADFGIMVLSRTVECRVSDVVVLSDTVIVGKVPDAFTDINKIEDELLGDVVDFSASVN